MLTVKDLYKSYRVGGSTYDVLSGVSLTVEKGEFVAVMGPSGSGKTTLLNILAGLDTPTSGQVLLTGRDMTTVRESQMAAFRREHLGFVFQEFNLLDTFTVRDNIFLPLVLSGQRFADMQPKL
ncbi:MAG: ABC transporter ATP-binding protein, partial [Oscillospiraceae bacterium]|nr:ABC transporter ATP-binding protein [Oscillospiraceae bacterium]